MIGETRRCRVCGFVDDEPASDRRADCGAWCDQTRLGLWMATATGAAAVSTGLTLCVTLLYRAGAGSWVRATFAVVLLPFAVVWVALACWWLRRVGSARPLPSADARRAIAWVMTYGSAACMLLALCAAV